ncbi:SDR family oxidoreductase [Demequina muriae]|uniref:SDR family NAD(P)-dependent oxidoreductase n=1 Tax=Demequina muriae TaxID=3051664 RepID=A0ABT8GJM8_9MICO|nr:SDR family NAD(P)-dependent oxidoreductase [Demequina sp. EGI L300058]MDN4481635.1 SDR family NAD(P)-dependent oxidoreductase [Demequina sp. EGI L300058]
MTVPRQRVAIITGAGSGHGIGFATALLLGAAGMRVVVTSTTDRIFDRVSQLRAAGIDAQGVVADLRDRSGADAVAARAASIDGRVDVLVNNAGMTSVSERDPAGAMSRWQASLERNLSTTFLMTSAVLDGMRSARYGRVVNVSSVSGPVAAYPGDVAYHAAKAGMVGLTRAVAIETASSGITVNAVAPGWIDTASASDHERRMGAASPVGRSGTAEEVAYVIAMLAGEGASYISGQLVIVDGANSVSEERGR